MCPEKSLLVDKTEKFVIASPTIRVYSMAQMNRRDGDGRAEICLKRHPGGSRPHGSIGAIVPDREHGLERRMMMSLVTGGGSRFKEYLLWRFSPPGCRNTPL